MNISSNTPLKTEPPSGEDAQSLEDLLSNAASEEERVDILNNLAFAVRFSDSRSRPLRARHCVGEFEQRFCALSSFRKQRLAEKCLEKFV